MNLASMTRPELAGTKSISRKSFGSRRTREVSRKRNMLRSQGRDTSASGPSVSPPPALSVRPKKKKRLFCRKISGRPCREMRRRDAAIGSARFPAPLCRADASVQPTGNDRCVPPQTLAPFFSSFATADTDHLY